MILLAVHRYRAPVVRSTVDREASGAGTPDVGGLRRPGATSELGAARQDASNAAGAAVGIGQIHRERLLSPGRRKRADEEDHRRYRVDETSRKRYRLLVEFSESLQRRPLIVSHVSSLAGLDFNSS